MRCPTLKELPPPPANKIGWPWTEESKQLSGESNKLLPRISIVTVNFNYGRFIEETIRSVLLSGYPDIEYIIMDGGSTDNSLEIIKKYEKWITYWVSKKDKGLYSALNKGFSESSGKILCWLNSDDIFNKDALKLAGQILCNSDRAEWLIGAADIVDENGLYLSSRSPNDVNMEMMLLWIDTWLIQSSIFWTRSMWEKVCPLNEKLSLAADLDLWFKMIRHAVPLTTKSKLSSFRYCDNTKSFIFKNEMRAETLYLLRSNYKELLPHISRDKKGVVKKHLTKEMLSFAFDRFAAGQYVRSLQHLAGTLDFLLCGYRHK